MLNLYTAEVQFQSMTEEYRRADCETMNTKEVRMSESSQERKQVLTREKGSYRISKTYIMS